MSLEVCPLNVFKNIDSCFAPPLKLWRQAVAGMTSEIELNSSLCIED
jgi:hypothetical protein